MTELLPCPFCGGRANFYINQVDFEDKHSVGCGDCNANMDVCEDSQAEAAEIWNTRSPSSAESEIDRQKREFAEWEWNRSDERARAAEARLEDALQLLEEARSNHIAGSDYDEAWDRRRGEVLNPVGGT